MSARRGSLTLTRLFVSGAPPSDLRKRYLAAIRLRAFKPLDPEGEESEASGWCVMERPFDLEFDSSKIFEDRYLILGLRVDRFRIPGLMIRSQLAEEEARLLAKTNKNRVSRNERLELRDKIILKLRKRIAPTTRSLDLVWDLDGGRVFFFSHSKRVVADFCELFNRTFGLTLEEDSPYLAAGRAELPEKLLRRLTTVEPLMLGRDRRKAPPNDEHAEPAPKRARGAAAPPEAEAEEQPELFQRIEATRFLGAEFLLWIWLRNEFLNQPLALGDQGGQFHVWLDRSLTLESPTDNHERVTITGAAPADGDEAREAVRARKFPVRSRIVLQSPERDYALALSAPRFQISGATVPAVLNRDSGEAFVERMTLAEELFRLLDRLYACFLRDRLSDAWQSGWQPAIVAWVEDKSIPSAALQALTPSLKRSRVS